MLTGHDHRREQVIEASAVDRYDSGCVQYAESRLYLAADLRENYERSNPSLKSNAKTFPSTPANFSVTMRWDRSWNGATAGIATQSRLQSTNTSLPCHDFDGTCSVSAPRSKLNLQITRHLLLI